MSESVNETLTFDNDCAIQQFNKLSLTFDEDRVGTEPKYGSGPKSHERQRVRTYMSQAT